MDDEMPKTLRIVPGDVMTTIQSRKAHKTQKEKKI